MLGHSMSTEAFMGAPPPENFIASQVGPEAISKVTYGKLA